MDNKDEKEIDQEREDDEDLELVEAIEAIGNRTNFEEASEMIRTRGFIKGLKL